MRGSPILYFPFDDILGYHGLADHEELALAASWARAADGTWVKIGAMKVGTVSETMVDAINRRVGLMIEWDDKITVARRV